MPSAWLGSAVAMPDEGHALALKSTGRVSRTGMCRCKLQHKQPSPSQAQAIAGSCTYGPCVLHLQSPWQHLPMRALWFAVLNHQCVILVCD